MDRELNKKLHEEQPLSVEETLRLDEALEAGHSFEALGTLLKDPLPSLAWRSELNQRLLQAAKGRRRERLAKWFSGVAATAAVASVAFLAVPKDMEPTESLGSISVSRKVGGASVEESLVTAHLEADVESGLGVATVATDSPSGS